jgi:hypothetical protein
MQHAGNLPAATRFAVGRVRSSGAFVLVHPLTPSATASSLATVRMNDGLEHSHGRSWKSWSSS